MDPDEGQPGGGRLLLITGGALDGISIYTNIILRVYQKQSFLLVLLLTRVRLHTSESPQTSP